MDVFIATHGTKISKEGDTFLIRTENERKNISPMKIKSLILSSRSSLTTDAIELANRFNVDIVVMDKYGNPYGRFWHCKFGSTAKIRRRQLEVFSSKEGMDISKAWVSKKLNSGCDHIKKLSHRRRDKTDLLNSKIENIRYYIRKIDELNSESEEVRQKIMGYEGNASKIYYSTISELLPLEYRFSKRTKRPALDPYNAYLNYGFGILYNKVEKACIIAGLDPFIGAIHTDGYNKKSLVFDMIEMHRYLVWETVFSLFSKKLVNKNQFEITKQGVNLNKEGKKIIAITLGDKLMKKLEHNGRLTTQGNIIQAKCHELSNYLIAMGDEEC